MDWGTLKNEFEQKVKPSIIWIENEYDKIRTGRVNLAIFDNIRIDAYGEKSPLKQIANLQIVDARQVVIKPYDKELCKPIMTELNNSNIGVTPQLNIDSIRLLFPPITEENRKQNVKKAKEILEQTKIKIRNARQDIQAKYKKNSELSDDTIKYFEDELNKATKQFNATAEALYQKKEKELLQI
ncbi:MAG: ribosome recycling factor [Mycoplasmataceae bacterium]|nr:ribosome recycling factor [Mycoplasmataceae bacterium]